MLQFLYKIEINLWVERLIYFFLQDKLTLKRAIVHLLYRREVGK